MFWGEEGVWKCIRDMQFGRRGRVPTRVVAICDESGEPSSIPTAPSLEKTLHQGAECEEPI